MSITVEIDQSGFIDITDYIIKAGKVPYIGRNRDWSVKAEPLTLSLSISSGISPAISDPIKVVCDSQVIFAGLIGRAPYNYNDRSYELEAITEIGSLGDYILEYDVCHSTFYNGGTGNAIGTYILSDYYSQPNVYVFYMLEKLFEIAGLTLDTSTVKATTAFNYDYGLGGGSQAVTYEDLWFNEEMLYCWGQSYGVNHSVLDDGGSDSQYAAGKPTFLAVLKEICSAFSVFPVITDVGAYELVFDTGNYTIADDDKYDYKSEPIKAKQPDAIAEMTLCLALNLSEEWGFFSNTTPRNPTVIRYSDLGSLPGRVSTPNIIKIFHDPRSTVNGNPFPSPFLAATGSSSSSQDPTYGNGTNITKNKYIAEAVDYTQEVIESPIQLTAKTVIQNYIDIEKQTSEIIQESY